MTSTLAAPAPQTLFRSWTPELEVRAGGDGRTVFGLAVPYNRAQRIDDQLVEQFAPGAFNKVIRAAAAAAKAGRPSRVPFARDHLPHGGQLIGAVTELRDDPAGLWFEARVADTQLGRDTLALLAEGALDQVSIGFRAGQNRKLPDGTVERVTADLRELAVVLQGAYGAAAAIDGVRSAEDLDLGDGESRAELEARAAQALAMIPSLPVLIG